MNKKTIQTTQKFKDNIVVKEGVDPIKEIMDKHGLDPKIWYPDTIKIKDGKWNTAAKKREQDLTWTKEIQTAQVKDAEGNIISTKETDNVQIMQGRSRHYPEFMLTENNTYSIEVTFKRFPVENDILESFKEIVKDMPILPKVRRKNPIRNGIAGEMATYDAHAAKLAWLQETGYRNYDLKIAMEDLTYASDKNLDLMAPHRPERLFYIIGQDLYHMDNMAGHTTNGSHTMDVDGRITKVHPTVFAVTRDNIYKASKLSHVEVIWIPGNHDFLSSYMLVFALKEHFRNNPNVTVDIGQNPRKARLWGTLLVGWTHRIVGKHTVWSNELSQAFPELWGQSKFREWHHGDQHKKQNVNVIPVFTSGGVICRQITALSPVDKWHTENVYTDAVPGGESFLWSKEAGVFANFMIWTGQYEENRNKLIKKL